MAKKKISFFIFVFDSPVIMKELGTYINNYELSRLKDSV